MVPRSKLLVVAAGLLMAAGCASTGGMGQSKTKVDELELARVPPSQLQPVNERRMDVQKAQDQVARHTTAINDAKRQHEVAKSEERVAKAQIDRAEAAVKAATEARNDQAAQQAREDRTRAGEREQVAKAQVKAAEERIKVEEAQKTLAEKQHEIAQIRLEESKFQALQRAGDPAAKNYSQASFDSELQKKQSELTEAQGKAQSQAQTYQQANREWQELRTRYQASGGQAPTG